MGDRYRANQGLLREAEQLTSSLGAQITALVSLRTPSCCEHSQLVTHLTTRLEQITQSQSAWQRDGAPRLAEISGLLEQGSYATRGAPQPGGDRRRAESHRVRRRGTRSRPAR